MQNKVIGNCEAAVTHLELTAREALAAEHSRVLTRDAAHVFLGCHGPWRHSWVFDGP